MMTEEAEEAERSLLSQEERNAPIIQIKITQILTDCRYPQ